MPSLFFGFQAVKEESTKSNIKSELASFKTPNGCTEVDRAYQAGGIDVKSLWYVYYECSATVGVIHSDLMSALKKNGYIVSDDPFDKEEHFDRHLSIPFYKSQEYLASCAFDFSEWEESGKTFENRNVKKITLSLRKI